MRACRSAVFVIVALGLATGPLAAQEAKTGEITP